MTARAANFADLSCSNLLQVPGPGWSLGGLALVLSRVNPARVVGDGHATLIEGPGHDLAVVDFQGSDEHFAFDSCIPTVIEISGTAFK